MYHSYHNCLVAHDKKKEKKENEKIIWNQNQNCRQSASVTSASDNKFKFEVSRVLILISSVNFMQYAIRD